MLADVTYPYRDRETGEVHLVGETVELTAERFAELSSRSFVADAAETADDARDSDDSDDAAETADDAGDAAETAGDAEMTVAELRAAIEAEGGFAPKKATKAELAGILESLR